MAEQAIGDAMNSKPTPSRKRASPETKELARTGTNPPDSTDYSAEARWRRTALAAFYRAEARGFAPGREVEDWLEAERELDALEAAQERQTAASASANEQAESMHASPLARKRTQSKRSKSERGATVQARNRGGES